MNVSPAVHTVLDIAVVMRSYQSVLLLFFWQMIIRTLFSVVLAQFPGGILQLVTADSTEKPLKTNLYQKTMCSSLPRLSEKTTRATARKADEYSKVL